MMDISFGGKTALVTGAGKGIGRAIAKALAASGATVHAISRTQVDLDSLQQEVVSKLMISHGHGGAIVNISSIDTLKPDISELVYGISKAAMDMVTKCFALELAQYQIRVNSVNPTLVPQTKMGQMTDEADQWLTKTPMRKLAEISDVVHAVLYLLSDKADMITGTSLPIDGGHLLS